MSSFKWWLYLSSGWLLFIRYKLLYNFYNQKLNKETWTAVGKETPTSLYDATVFIREYLEDLNGPLYLFGCFVNRYQERKDGERLIFCLQRSTSFSQLWNTLMLSLYSAIRCFCVLWLEVPREWKVTTCYKGLPVSKSTSLPHLGRTPSPALLHQPAPSSLLFLLC